MVSLSKNKLKERQKKKQKIKCAEQKTNEMKCSLKIKNNPVMQSLSKKLFSVHKFFVKEGGCVPYQKIFAGDSGRNEVLELLLTLLGFGCSCTID